jgi:hypothetical protein
MSKEGKFCGFVWFIIPKLMINQKYRIRKMAGIKAQVPSAEKGEKGEENNNLSQNFDEEEEEPI